MAFRFLPGFLLCLLGAAAGAASPPIDVDLTDVPYPYPVSFFELPTDSAAPAPAPASAAGTASSPSAAAPVPIRMAYMDVLPNAKTMNGQTVVLLHGKNFAGYSPYWDGLIATLTGAGYRVVAPDMPGWGKSSKPSGPYHFATLSADLVALLDSLGLSGPVVVLGHSTGGMLAIHFTLLHPDRVAKLVLEDPIGLEDYARLAPPQSDATLYQDELKNKDPVKIAAFFARYFTEPRPDLVPDLAKVPIGVTKSRNFPVWAKASARAYQMIYSEPVVGRFPEIQTPTLLVVGAEDHAAPFAAYATPELRSTMGQIASLAQAAAAAMPHARLEIIPECGHIPHLERPTAFKKIVLDFLSDPLTPNP